MSDRSIILRVLIIIALLAILIYVIHDWREYMKRVMAPDLVTTDIEEVHVFKKGCISSNGSVKHVIFNSEHKLWCYRE